MHVLISGASIAGPALAFWLHRHGIDVTVVERAPALREGGYCVDIRGVALDVVARMGLREALRPLEADTLENVMVDERGRRFGRTPRGFGVIDPDDIEILRGDLAGVLFTATRAQVRYRFGDSVAALRQRDRGVEVTFASGDTATFDLVVGADGVHSQVRALAFGPERECLRAMGSAMAIFTAPNHLGLHRQQLLYSGLRRIASVKSTHGDRDLMCAVFFAHRDGFDHRDVPAQRRLVAAAFADAGWEFPRLIGAMQGADDFYCDLTCQIRLPTLSRGRVALVGDAGYCPSPLSGQGTSLALVGAYVLAVELARSADISTALRRYDERVLPFVRRNQDIALKLGGGFAPESPFQVRVRRLAMKLMPYMPGSSLMMKLAMRGIREASRDLELPASIHAPRADAVAPEPIVTGTSGQV
ncbi:FAD-dependent monooxygenase [Nannocystis pusilla]|uniref:FAD-dependent monooxygenase n=1 Tax=Nannocystis pusilla TaxID=889268 RepID=UPI003DA287D3